MLVRRIFANTSAPLDCSADPSRTRQEFTHDADINNIVRRFLRDGVLPLVNANRPLETDGLSLPGDFQEACEAAFDKQNEQLEMSLHDPRLNQVESNGDNQQPASAASEEASNE